AGWTPTLAYLRGCRVGVVLLLAALLFHSPSLTGLATPFLAVTVWSLVTRPTRPPIMQHPVALPALREGESMRWRVELSTEPGLDHANLVFERADFQELRPA